ncbi:MAG: sister chromatid cohesion protein PDS5 [Bacteroidota bacterium]
MEPTYGILRDFTTVSECYLKLNEQQRVKSEEMQDQLMQHEAMLRWVKKPIALNDLFKSRSLQPDGPKKEIHKVLLTGEAGTGKTSLTKKIAYAWSIGEWGQEFHVVYLLPIRALLADKYDNKGNYRTESTVATAITNECFAGTRTEKEFLALRDRVATSLGQATTLVILDGLDEQFGVSKNILQAAKAGKHKLLLTSRPYSIETERSVVDIEVDNIGFNTEQRDNFINYLLADPPLATRLISFIQAQKLQAMASIPVNLKILCTLWKRSRSKLDEPGTYIGLSILYRKLVNHVWDRFAYETGKQGDHHSVRAYRSNDMGKQDIFQDLEKIALAGLQEGKLIIDRYSIQEILGDKSPSHLLEDAGFLLLQKVEQQYQFPHLTFQEYFAGRGLARQFLTGDKKTVIKFLKHHMYIPNYRRTLAFMSGEIVKGMARETNPIVANNPDAKGIIPIQALLQLIDEFPKELLGLQHLILQLRLLNEWLLVEDEDEKDETLPALESQFQLGQTLSTWVERGLHQYDRYEAPTQVIYETLQSLLAEARGVAKHYGGRLLSPILNALKDSDFDVRRSATEALRILIEEGADVKKALPFVVNALKDTHSDVRRAACEALGDLLEKGTAIKEVIAHMLKDLEDSHAPTRRAAINSLGVLAKHGESAGEMLPHMLSALQDSDRTVRGAAIEAIEILVNQGTTVQELVSPMLNALKDSDVHVRSAARKVLLTLIAKGATVEDVLPSVMCMLRDDHADMHKVAMEILKPLIERSTKVDEVLPTMLEALKDSHAHVRGVAIEVLGILAGQSAKVKELLPPMLLALKDSNSFVRRSVRQALEPLVQKGVTTTEVLPFVLDALGNSDNDVRRAAVNSLMILAKQGASTEEVLPTILRTLKDSNWSVRSASIEVLGVLAETGADIKKLLPLILDALEDSHSDVCRAAIKVLAILADQGASIQEVLLHLPNTLKSNDWHVRSASLELIGTLLNRDASAQEMLLSPVLDALADSHFGVRNAAIKVLLILVEKGIAVQEMLSHILAALGDDEDEVRKVVLKSLGDLAEEHISTQEILSHILYAFEDNRYKVRRTAIQALGILVNRSVVGRDVPGIILNARKDSHSVVRRAAIEALWILAEKNVEAKKVLPAIMSTLNDSDSYVRSTASKALRTLAEKGIAVKELLPLMLDALTDSNPYVRKTALTGLGVLIEQNKARLLKEVLPSVLNALQDKDPDARYAAIETLGKVSTRDLIDYYWEEKEESIIPFLVPRLYEAALTVGDGRSGSKKITLYASTGKVISWKGSAEEVEDLTRLLASTAPYFDKK